jgi:hypothetical protein
MSYAEKNLSENVVYQDLVHTTIGHKDFVDGKVVITKPAPLTMNDACNICHGTKVEVKGLETRETDEGEMDFPVLTGWPNQGVGRVNPDLSRGSCSACHTRHQFSIKMARKPHTCSQCHKGPDVPAYPVYKVSKHGNVYASLEKDWNFDAVPWTIGQDLTAPTCATCHMSLLVNEDGEPLAKRTHQVNDRLSWRLLGLIYAHPHPESPDTTIIKNKAGLPLPTELTGEPVSDYLISPEEQKKRRAVMTGVCRSCHGQQWVAGHFKKLEHTIDASNKSILTVTKMMLSAWEKGAAKGLAQKDSIFNEGLEKKWISEWLFYANSIRYASAMMGADYGVFANGRWSESENIQDLLDWLHIKQEKSKN